MLALPAESCLSAPLPSTQQKDAVRFLTPASRSPLPLLTNLLVGQAQPAGVGGHWPVDPFFAPAPIIYGYQTSALL